MLVGQRRVGKSYLLLQIKDLLEQRKFKVIYLSKEQHAFAAIKNAADLLRFVAKKTYPKQKNALLIDEVQEIAQFENALTRNCAI